MPSAPASSAASSPLHREISALYAGHHGWLQGWLRRRLGNGADAADLAQDTFVRILGVRDLAGVQEPRAYLTTVAKGVLVNWYKRQALEQAYLEALAALPEPVAPSPEQRALVLETLHEIDAMLDALPPIVRRTFLLSQLDGMKYEDIAQQLEVSLTSVKRYMAQAFRQCLVAMA
ncbi:sigma-70 family RNA polymerase sigma factor [Delftia sp. WSY_22]|uniref:sigma-70 family RNA polymerase sigma factor n=1 Tax=Delftia sp. WSY_22 TaxID=3367213 RepID=UPI00370C7D17